MTIIDKKHFHVYSDTTALSIASAMRWTELAQLAISDHGQFHVALSGGSTPKLLYEQLALPQFSSHIDWSNVHIYFGDERNVPSDHPDSNYRMANETLISKVPLSVEQAHRIEIDNAKPEHVANAYNECLLNHLPRDEQGHCCFDLVLLGLGPDGHVASLFPGTELLNEQHKLVGAVYVEKLQTWRISISFPVINHASHIMLLVAGDNKADIVEHLFSTTHEVLLPVEMIRPTGTMEWFVDQRAAMQIDVKPDHRNC